MHTGLERVLMCYVCYRPDVGYVQVRCYYVTLGCLAECAVVLCVVLRCFYGPQLDDVRSLLWCCEHSCSCCRGYAWWFCASGVLCCAALLCADFSSCGRLFFAVVL
jgi:hypothetical protein